VSFLGFLLSFGIRGEKLEAEGWDEEDQSEAEYEDDDDEDEDESTALRREEHPGFFARIRHSVADWF
jgi:hypothetical protein